jgi:hypothetical protein
MIKSLFPKFYKRNQELSSLYGYAETARSRYHDFYLTEDGRGGTVYALQFEALKSEYDQLRSWYHPKLKPLIEP